MQIEVTLNGKDRGGLYARIGAKAGTLFWVQLANSHLRAPGPVDPAQLQAAAQQRYATALSAGRELCAMLGVGWDGPAVARAVGGSAVELLLDGQVDYRDLPDAARLAVAQTTRQMLPGLLAQALRQEG